MEDILRKLENLIDEIIDERNDLREELKRSNVEIERLKNENVDLKVLIHEQSVRVEALMKKLEQTVIDGSEKKGV